LGKKITILMEVSAQNGEAHSGIDETSGLMDRRDSRSGHLTF
jgi:hypothetical protein